MLSSPEFVEWSDQVVLFLHVTSHPPSGTPLEDEKYPDLLTATGHNAFPSVCFMAADGRVVNRLERVSGVEDLEAGLMRLENWKELQERAAANPDDAALQRRLFVVELDLGVLSYDEASKKVDDLAFEGDELAEVRQQLVNLQFLDLLATANAENAVEVGTRFLEMFDAGRIPTARQDTSFYQLIFAALGQKGDAERFEEMIDWIEKEKADDPRLRRYLPMLKRQLDRLKDTKKR